MIEQRTSPLFRIPRELRDEIYAYYSHEDDGLLYDFPSRRLRFVNGRGLELSYTCKAIAEEMRGLPLRLNTITFTSSCDQPVDDDFRGLRSRASRFENLLHSARWTKLVMLHYAAELVTDDILANVVQAFPCLSSVYKSAFRAIQSGRDFYHMGQPDAMVQDVFTTSFCDAMQYTLDQIASLPSFDTLAGKACTVPKHYQGLCPFLEGTHRQVLNWRPSPWHIPTIRELQVLEQLLVPVTPGQWNWTGEYENVTLYFSATAICIDALSRLQTDIRKNVRSINLQEEARSISNPETHAEGLIPFCLENSKLHIHMQAGFYTNLVPSCWAKSEAVTRPPKCVTWCLLHDHMRVVLEWLIRLAALPSQGMPSASFVVELEARSDEAAYIWDSIINAATLRASLPAAMADYEEHDIQDKEVLTNMFSCVWRLPAQLPSMMKDIANQTLPVRLDLGNNDISPVPVVLKDCSAWTFIDWIRSYTPRIKRVQFPGDSKAYCRKHFVELEQPV